MAMVGAGVSEHELSWSLCMTYNLDLDGHFPKRNPGDDNAAMGLEWFTQGEKLSVV